MMCVFYFYSLITKSVKKLYVQNPDFFHGKLLYYKNCFMEKTFFNTHQVHFTRNFEIFRWIKL